MSRVKLVLSAFVAVLALSALASASASAAEAGWMVNGAMLSGSKALATTAKVDEKAKLTAANVTITCSGETLNGTVPQITSPNKGSAGGLEFTGCAVSAGECTLATEDKNIKTAAILAEATLEGTLAVNVTFKPETGKVFTTIKYEGAKCALAGIQPVKGEAVVLDPTGQDESASQLIKVSATSKLEVGSSAATLEGSALLKLASGETWSFL